MKLSPEAQTAINVITEAGGRPLPVGGCVRDFLLGVESKDIDIEVYGSVKPEVIQEALSAVGRVDAVGVSFGVLKFGKDVDISFPRRELKTGEGHGGFSVTIDQTLDPRQAMLRRDLTVNALAYDPVRHEVLDYFKGVEHLRARRLVRTSSAFKEDPLRVLRGVQFAGRFGFSIERETAALCQSLAEEFETISIERVWMEWEKILMKGVSMEAVWIALDSTGWLQFFPEWGYGAALETDEIIPLLDRMKIGGQRRAAIILASMFRGSSELKSFLGRIDAPRWLRKNSTLLAATEFPVGRMRDVQVRILARKMKEIQLTDWLLAHGWTPGSGPWAAALRQGVMTKVLPPFVTGDSLIERGLEPGPKFSVILEKAIETQDIEGWTTVAQSQEWLDRRLPR